MTIARFLTCVAMSSAFAAVPSALAAQEYVAAGSHQALEFDKPIGRIDLDRDGVVSVSLTSARAIKVAGIAPGETELQIFARDGSLLKATSFRVPDPALDGGAAPDLSRSAQDVVAVDVQFAAVSTSTLKALGFNFSRLTGDIQGAVISPNSLNSAAFNPEGLSISASAPIQEAFNLFLAAPNRGIGAALSALSSTGLSQLLAQPTLLARSGEQASFLAGGEVPIPVPGVAAAGVGNAVTIEYKQFGVRLAVTPFVMKNDRIVLKVAPEVSELDFGIGVQLQGFVVPGLRRRSAETTVELNAGQSFVIAGLSFSNSNVTDSRVPFLGDIPIIGALFRRQREANEQQELIIVVTPRVVNALNPDEIPPLPGTAPAALPKSPARPQKANSFGVVRN